MLHMIARNVIGHSGFELFPRGTARHRVFGWLTTNTHHDLHHSDDSVNYGLYFTWWDRLMTTEHPEYREIFDRVVVRKKRGAIPDRNSSPGWEGVATSKERGK